MNEQNDRELPGPPTTAQIERMESAVMASIGAGRPRESAPAARGGHSRVWAGVAAAAAVVAVAAIIAPAVTSSVSGGGSSSAVSDASYPEMGSVPLDESGVQLIDPGAAQGASGSAPDGAADSVSGSRGEAATGDAQAGRDVVATGWVQVTVADVPAAVDRITDLAKSAEGYVESATVGGSGVRPVDGDTSLPVSSSQVSIRVPADRLDSVIAEVGGFGEITSSTIDRTDVTDQTVDLRARIAAQQASVTRLTELMSQAGSVGDLIAAETALSERQAALDSDTQQLASLEDRVALSSLTISLTPESAPTQADPAGFGDGLAAGWNGLVAALNGTVIALGFLLPWIVLVAVVGTILWAVRRAVRRRRAHERPTASGE